MYERPQSQQSDDRYNLQRFVTAQERVSDQVLGELRAGCKMSHWIWFIFPQIQGLGRSPVSQEYAISGREEAKAYLQHPLLGARLKNCTQLVLQVGDRSALDIFGSPDDMKFRSCMTLFAAVAEAGSVFHVALEKFFKGKGDEVTLARLETESSHEKA